MDNLEGQTGQEGQPVQIPTEPPESPAIDPRVAMEIAAQQFGVTPDYLEGSIRLQDENRRQIDSFKRRERELELKEARLEAMLSERQRYEPAPAYENIDPAVRPIYEEMKEMKKMFLDERQERADGERKMEEARRIGEELNEHFQSVMRTLPTQQQMDPQRFFGSMRELWPNGPPEGITPDRAVSITAKYLGIQTNGVGPSTLTTQNQTNYPYRNPRASIVIPGGSTGNMVTAQTPDTSPQKSGETIEQYSQRIEQAGRWTQRMIQESGIRNLPDRYSSG